MAWQTPDLAEVRRLARDNVSARLPGSDLSVGNSAMRVLTEGNAGLAHLTLLYIDHLALMFLPDTATGEWLDRWGAIYGLPRQAATFADGAVTVTGIEGTVLPIGSQLAGSGLSYETTEQVTIGATPTAVSVRALSAGVIGNAAAGATMSLLTAVAGVDGTATVVTLAGGADTEADTSLRDRILARIRLPPMGGAAHDYVAWAREVPGVTRAWCSPTELGPGTVTVRFMMDEVRANNGGFPISEDLDIVQAHIDTKRPVAVRDFYVRAPTPEPVGFTITSLITDTPSIRAAIAVSVDEMLRDRAAPARAVNGVRIAAQTIHREWVSAAILATPGVESFELIMSDHVMPSSGSMATLGAITYA